MTTQTKLGDILGTIDEEVFNEFDLTEIQKVLKTLSNTTPIDLAHCELLQQQALRGADLLSEYLGKMIKTVGVLETKVNSIKNKSALNYQAPEGQKATMDMRKYAAEASPDVEEAQIKLAKAKGSKSVLENKFNIMIKAHHHWKDMAMGMRRTVLGYGVGSQEKEIKEGPQGWND